MIQITGLRSSPFQSFNIPDPDKRKTVYFTLRFSPRTQTWYIDIEYEGFIANGIKVVRGMNILKRNINTLPFGLMVTVSDNLEPFLINDFVSGRVSIYILSHSECVDVENMIIEGYSVP